MPTTTPIYPVSAQRESYIAIVVNQINVDDNDMYATLKTHNPCFSKYFLLRRISLQRRNQVVVVLHWTEPGCVIRFIYFLVSAMRSCSLILLYFSLPVSLGFATSPGCNSLSLAMTNLKSNIQQRRNVAAPQSLSSKASGGSLSSDTETMAPALAATDKAVDPSTPKGLSSWMSPRRLSVAVILLAAFLNLLGFTMAGKKVSYC